MPNRVIKDSITCSKEIDSLTWFEEVLFYRLIVKVDDFGRFYADPQIIKSELFPRKEDLTKKAVEDALKKIEKVGLIRTYNWDGSPYLEITKWAEHQQRRAKTSKFPDSKGNRMIADDSKCNQMKSNDSKRNQKKSSVSNGLQMSPNTNTKSNTKSESYTTDEEAVAIQRDHDEILDAATEIGLPKSNGNFKDLIDLYADCGKEAVIYAIGQARKYNKISVAYIESVAKNYGTPKEENEEVNLLF